jgi:tetratricopeptide (TPR) repeat protein
MRYNKSKLLFSKRNCFLQDAKIRKAISIYSFRVNKFPNNSMTLSFRGNAYFAVKDYAKALNDYNESIKNKENVVNDIEANQNHTQLLRTNRNIRKWIYCIDANKYCRIEICLRKL